MKQLIAVLFAAAALAQQAKPPERVDWVRLRGLNPKTGRINADAKLLDGAEVRMVGFMVPFEDEQSQTTEFLIVPNTACIHVPAPPANQIVLVTMEGNKKTKVWLSQAVWVEGKMKIETANSPYGNVSYKMVAKRVELAKDI